MSCPEPPSIVGNALRIRAARRHHIGAAACLLALACSSRDAEKPGVEHARLHSPWAGLVDRSDELGTTSYSFNGSSPEAGDNNINYYDGDFADFDGDGRLDRALISRYGLLWNRGAGEMTPTANVPVNLTNFQFGDKDAIGNDGVRWADVDGDGDVDNLQGGNGEPFTLQLNRQGRFSVEWKKSGSATDITRIDVEGDGDVDLVASESFCFTRNCGQPTDFKLWINQGNANFVDQTAARGLGRYADERVTDVMAADLDRDGDFDLLIVNGGRDAVSNDCNIAAGGRSQLSVLFNQGGNFTETPFYDVPCIDPGTWGGGLGAGGLGENAALGDVDGDGHLDLVTAANGRFGSHAQVYHAIFINDGSGGFTEDSAARFDVGTFTGNLYGKHAKLADIDHDGDLDFISFVQEGSGFDGLGTELLQIFLNDGSGNFTFVPDAWPRYPIPSTGGLNSMDVADFDGDGSLDIWIGHQGDRVRTLTNARTDPSGLPGDMPRNVAVKSATSAGVTIAWDPPPFASTVRHYRVYRSTLPNQPVRDRPLLRTVAITPHADETLVAPITARTTTAELGNPGVTLSSGSVELVDATPRPGVTYYYSIVHIGPETKASEPTPEVAASAPSTGGIDTTGPTLQIVSPVTDAWSRYGRVVLHYGDGGSGIDASSLAVSFDRDLGGGARSAGANLADIFFTKDSRGYVAAFEPPLALPLNQAATLTASISDNAGNTTTRQVTFDVNVDSAMLPTASMTATAAGGGDWDFSGVASTDDRKIMRWEWYFGDGTSAIGHSVRHTFTSGGTFTTTLLVRDNDGGVSTTSQSINVAGPPGTGGAAGGGGVGGSAGLAGAAGSAGAGQGGSSGAGGAGATGGSAGSTAAGGFPASGGATAAGGSPASSGGAESGGSTAAGSGGQAATDPEKSSGCACHASGRSTGYGTLTLAALVAVMTVRRRRRASDTGRQRSLTVFRIERPSEADTSEQVFPSDVVPKLYQRPKIEVSVLGCRDLDARTDVPPADAQLEARRDRDDNRPFLFAPDWRIGTYLDQRRQHRRRLLIEHERVGQRNVGLQHHCTFGLELGREIDL